MIKSFFLCSLFLWVSYSVQSQYRYSSNTAHVSLERAILLNSDVIQERTANFEKKVASKPLMFVSVKRKISDLNIAANSLSSLIISLQKEVNSERVLYELLEEDFYKNILFKPNGQLTVKGNELKQKIDFLYKVANAINIHKLSGLTDFINQHFNTKEVYYDAEENKVNYFDHFFYDKTNYGIMMNLNYLLLDIKVYQLLYYRTVMSY